MLLSKNLAPQQILTVNVDVNAAGSGSAGQADDHGRVSVAVDTTREWIDETLVIGGIQKGNDHEDALTVVQASGAVGQKDVWVSGYVVGGDLTPSSASYAIPFASRTNILLGSRSTTSDRESCLAVQLLAGQVRDNLNLVDNSWLMGRRICLKGDIVEAYYGITGLKEVSDFVID